MGCSTGEKLSNEWLLRRLKRWFAGRLKLPAEGKREKAELILFLFSHNASEKPGFIVL